MMLHISWELVKNIKCERWRLFTIWVGHVFLDTLYKSWCKINSLKTPCLDIHHTHTHTHWQKPNPPYLQLSVMVWGVENCSYCPFSRVLHTNCLPAKSGWLESRDMTRVLFRASQIPSRFRFETLVNLNEIKHINLWNRDDRRNIVRGVDGGLMIVCGYIGWRRDNIWDIMTDSKLCQRRYSEKGKQVT